MFKYEVVKFILQKWGEEEIESSEMVIRRNQVPKKF